MIPSLPLTAAFLGASLLFPPLLPQQRQEFTPAPSWENAVQSSLRADTEEARRSAAIASDFTLGASVAAGAAAVAAQSTEGKDSGRFALGAAQALALNSAITFTTKRLVGRWRPDAAAGDTNPDSAQSFFSGHASFAFLGAAVACRATQWPGQRTPDWLCPAALATAGATAYLRVRANRHWISDVAIGALVGTASGWLLTPGSPETSDARGTLPSTPPAFRLTLGF